MENETQLQRYKKLISYIDAHFKEQIDIPKIEEICHYSYRNINRIFLALHHETIGKYIKRIRLEKAAQYLKYDDASVGDIAFEVGFSDSAAFTKAFKAKFNCSPSSFRNSQTWMQEITLNAINEQAYSLQKIPYEVETLPAFTILYLPYKGDYNDFKSLNTTWERFSAYIHKNNLINEQSIILSEILDDNEISDSINCRCNCAMIIEEPLKFEPMGLFNTKTINKQKYAKFIHQGSHETMHETYDAIYARWLIDIKFSFADKPNLEFYLNDEINMPKEALITEIYIPII